MSSNVSGVSSLLSEGKALHALTAHTPKPGCARGFSLVSLCGWRAATRLVKAANAAARTNADWQSVVRSPRRLAPPGKPDRVPVEVLLPPMHNPQRIDGGRQRRDGR